MRVPIAQRICRRTRYSIPTPLSVLALVALFSAGVCAQQITVTFSKGDPGSPFSQPTYTAFDKQGNLFISDTNNHRVQRIDKQTGAVTMVVGTGTAGSIGDGGPATQAQINCPVGLAFDATGNLYVADRCQNVVRKIVPGADSILTGASDEIITSFAGSGSVASCTLVSGVPATQTPINQPTALATDQAGNLFMIAGETAGGSCSQLVQRVDASSGTLNTVEIIGPSPSPGLAFDQSGNLFVWAFQESLLKCTPAALTQIADPFTGNPGCQTAASNPSFTLLLPPAMTFDKAGNLYLSNDENACDGGCTAIFELATGASGIGFDSVYSLYAGTTQPGYSGDGGPPLNATFNTPVGLAFNDAGNLFIGDSRNNVIRAVLNCAATAAGSGVSVNPLDQNGTSRKDVNVTFDSVTIPGCSVVVTRQLPAPLPTGLQLAGSPAVTFDIISSAQFTGNATVCITSNPLSPDAKLLNFIPATQSWNDITQSIDQNTGVICGTSASLSPAAVVQPGPPAPVLTAHPSNPTNQTTATFSFTDSDNTVASFSCTIDGTTSPCTSGVAYPNLADGSHTFSVTGQTAGGISSASASFTWVVDTVAPPTPIITQQPTDPSSTANASFSFSDTESGVTYKCTLDATTASCTSPASYSNLTEGLRHFSVVAIDAAGNQSAPSMFQWTIQLGPPMPQITSAPSDPSNQNPAPFGFTDTQAGVTFQCKLDTGAFQACTSGISYPSLTDGIHTFSVQAVDTSGRISPTASLSWTMDTTPPQAPQLTSEPANPSNFTQATFSFVDVSGDVASYLCSLDSATFSLCSSGATFTVAAGTHTFAVEAKDTARNIGPSTSYTWAVDTTNLVVSLLSFPANPTNQATATFTFASQTPNVTFQCSIDGGGFAPCSTPVSYPNLAENTHTFQVKATDLAGTTGAPASYVWVIDLTPPTVPVFATRPSDPTGIIKSQNGQFFVFSSLDKGGLLEYLCSIDGSAASICNPQLPSSGIINILGLQDGSHTLVVQAVDTAGNISLAQYTWVLDLTPPVVTPPPDIVLVSTPTGLESSQYSAAQAFLTGATAVDNHTAQPNFLYDANESGSPFAQPTQPCPLNPLTDQNTLLTEFSGQSGLLTLPDVGDFCVGFGFMDDAGNIGVAYAHAEVVMGVATPDPQTGNTVVPIDPRSQQTPQAKSNVTVSFSGGIHFSGYTGVNITPNGPTLPAGFKLGNPPQYYDIVTTAQYRAPIVVCIAASPLPAGSALLHFNQQTQQWEDLTVKPVPANGPICAQVNSLSPFAVVQPLDNPPTANAGTNQTIEATSSAGAAVTLSGAGSDPDSDPLTFTWSENGVRLGTLAQITISLPIGSHTITLTADDGRGGTGTSTVLVIVQDTTPPIFTPPANQTLEATGPTGAVAVFSATATDLVDGVRPVICSPASGSTFPLGATTVACNSTDLHGNSSNGTFTLTVRDTKPPVVTPPASITIPATEAGGARGAAWLALAAFLGGATARDTADPAPSQLSPQVGGTNADSTTLFPFGTTAVTFRFRDASGNIGSATAKVTVILGTVKISGQIASKGKNSDGTYYVDVKLTNTGTGNARKLRVTALTATTTKGTGKINIISPAFPMSVGLGNLDVGASQTVHFLLKVPSTVQQFVLVDGGDFVNAKGTLGLFALTQTATP